MTIKLYDYAGIEARQIIGSNDFVIDTEKNEAIIFIKERKAEFKFYNFEFNTDYQLLSFYLYRNAEEAKKGRGL